MISHGHRAGGRVPDYPSQKDPIPEVTLQRVRRCRCSRRETKGSKQPDCPGPSRPASARSVSMMGQRHGRPVPQSTFGEPLRRRPGTRRTSLSKKSRVTLSAEHLCPRSPLRQRTGSSIDPITQLSVGVPSFPGRTSHNRLCRPGRLCYAFPNRSNRATSMWSACRGFLLRLSFAVGNLVERVNQCRRPTFPIGPVPDSDMIAGADEG
jgi:hypothetical protein